MKKTIILLFVFFFGLKTTNAQDLGNRVVSKGKSTINVYYGVNLLTSVYRTAATNVNANSKATDISVKSVGPIGVMYEYMVTNGIGIGGEVGYGSTEVSFKDVVYNGSSSTYRTYNYDFKFALTRVMFRANFHFSKSDKFDAYGLVSAGYRGVTWSINTDDPGLTGFRVSGFVPFGIKPGMGFRYFFTDNVGVNLEIAVGTPVMSGGISFKF